MSLDQIKQEVPQDLVMRFEELAEKMVDTLRYSCRYEHGPQLAVQMMLLTMIRVGIQANPDIVDKLKVALDIAFVQVKEEMS